MDRQNESQIEPRAALAHARSVSERVRRQGRWHGWVWLIVAVATPVFLIATRSDALSRETQFWIAVGFGALGGGLALWEARRGVVGREAAIVDRPMTVAYAALVVAAALVAIVLNPEGPPAWFIAVALLPSIPALVAGWLVLKG